jgi:Fe2+ or Zn2+ uptake regulation protein
MAQTTTETLSTELASKGYRLTRPRRAVLRVVAEAQESLSPAEIHARARKFYPQT